MAAGCITGLAAFVNAIKVGSVTSTAGNQLETQIMIALVLGGMPVNGGAKVRFYNIILGVMTYKVLSSGLVMLMMPTQLQQLILGSHLPDRSSNLQRQEDWYDREVINCIISII